MKVDFYANCKSNVPMDRPKDVYFYLDRIKTGKSLKIIQSLRLETDELKQKMIKERLPAVCFGGVFSRRAKTALKKASGLLILDFDKVDIKLKNDFINDKYTFACWVSPRGNGLKVLCKIPIVTSNEEYVNYFNQSVQHFKYIAEADESGKDISRLCFESYDNELYLNDESLTFDIIHSVETTLDYSTIHVETNIPIIDSNEIANRLMVWFKKHYNGSARNNSYHKLALAFNDFGVPQNVCEMYIMPAQQKDFDEREIKSLIDSAYKHTHNFGSKKFEDHKKKKAIEGLATIGKTSSEIKSKFKEIPAESIDKEIESIKKNIDVNVFWSYDNRGRLQISAHKFKYYLEHNNYFKHYPVEKSKTFLFVKKDEFFVDEVYESQIKDFVLTDQLELGNLNVYDTLAQSSRSFNNEFLSMLSNAQFNIEEDTKDSALIYFKNKAIKVFANGINEIDYSDLGGFVWKKQVIDRDFIHSDHHESEFRTFIWLCSSKDPDKYNSIKSVIGYLLHSYKTSANNKAIILNDETISDNPNGGSGKSLFWNAIKHIKKVASIDGKTFEFTKSFPYQSVQTDTQLLVFDDVKKNFAFENLFSLITEGITLEYKGQDAIKLPVNKSPKIMITTNYTIGGIGGSFERRKFEIEMSSYFNASHSPLDEFGHMLFDDWSTDEWARFDLYMINCLQYYLANGLVEFKHKSLSMRKLINETNSDFLEWFNENITYGTRIDKKDFFIKFIEDNMDFKSYLKQKRFTMWIQSFCKYQNKQYTEQSSNGRKYFIIEGNEDKCPF